ALIVDALHTPVILPLYRPAFCRPVCASLICAAVHFGAAAVALAGAAFAVAAAAGFAFAACAFATCVDSNAHRPTAARVMSCFIRKTPSSGGSPRAFSIRRVGMNDAVLVRPNR